MRGAKDSVTVKGPPWSGHIPRGGALLSLCWAAMWNALGTYKVTVQQSVRRQGNRVMTKKPHDKFK